MSLWQNAEATRLAVVRRPLKPIAVQIHPVAAALILLALLALLGWAGATTSYALFRDEFLMGIVSRNAAAERATTAEIARLKAELDRASTKLLVEREGFIDKLDVLAKRQADVERRNEALSDLPAASSAPIDIPADELRLRPAEPKRESRAGGVSARPTMAELAARYDALDRVQKSDMAQLQAKLDRERANVSKVYASLGLAPLAASPVKAGMGGLYIPLFAGRPDTASAELASLKERAAENARLRQGLNRLPVGNPAPGAQAVSAFGSRVDPFLGTMAFHSGLDLDLPAGAPAFASASGRVVSAGWNGGYGLMVEIRHDHGYSTRYAHLSSIAVREGQDIRVGDKVGLVGSTGRSTGPHLHYETRKDDTPLDPRRFLAAAAALAD